MSGKTQLGKKMMDAWLMKHPGKKALILDTKSEKRYIRYFVPNPQIQEANDGRGK